MLIQCNGLIAVYCLCHISTRFGNNYFGGTIGMKPNPKKLVEGLLDDKPVS